MTITDTSLALLRMLPPRVRWTWMAVVILSVIAALAELFVAAAIFALVASVRGDGAVHLPGPFDGRPSTVLIFVAVLVLARNVMLVVASSIQARAVTSSIAAGFARVTGGLLTMPFRTHLRMSSARLLQNTVGEVDISYREYLSAAVTLIGETLVAICIAIALLVLTPGPTLLVVLLIGVVMVVIVRITSKAAHRAGVETHGAQVAMIRSLQELGGGMREIRAAQRESTFHRRATRAAESFAEALRRSLILLAVPRLVNETMLVVAAILVCVVLAREHVPAEEILATAGVFAYAGFRIIPSANRIGYALTLLRKRHHGAIELTNFVREVGESSPVERPRRSFAFEKTVDVRDVTFTYGDAAQPALRGVSLTIRKGETVAIVGTNGSGKSTLLDLLVGILAPDAGTIAIDGRPLDEWRALTPPVVAYVPQLPFLLDETLAANIAFGEENADRDAIERAAKTARIDLAAGATLGERGSHLSGGQRQRTALARALYADAEILVLDEATSALDPEVEAHLAAVLHEMRGSRTIILATQNMATTRACDTIVVLDQGLVAASGTYEQLLAESEAFRRLASAKR